MEKIVLKAEKRDKNEKLKSLRMSKLTPAVVYGHKQESIAIKVNSSDLIKAYRIAGENHIIKLNIDDKKTIDVLIHEIQKSPISGDILHVDFYAITKGEKVHTHIPLVFTGVSKAKTDEGAIIEELLKQVEVKCLPTDLIENIEVDLSKLEKIGDNIKISDLIIPGNIEILNNKDEVIAIATKAKVEKIEDKAPELVLPEDPKEKEKEAKSE